MTQDRDRVRTRLLELRRELTDRHQRIDRHIEHRDEPLPTDSQERAGELANHETMRGLDDNVVAELGQIDRALTRLDTGEYGRCEACQQPIPAERLDFLPFATRCTQCASTAG